MLPFVFQWVLLKMAGRAGEDRRPASNADPYKVAAAIIETVKASSGAPSDFVKK